MSAPRDARLRVVGGTGEAARLERNFKISEALMGNRNAGRAKGQAAVEPSRAGDGAMPGHDAAEPTYPLTLGQIEAIVDAESAQHPLITQDELYALHLASRALTEVAAGLWRDGQKELATESARSATALGDLLRRATVMPARDQQAEREAER